MINLFKNSLIFFIVFLFFANCDNSVPQGYNSRLLHITSQPYSGEFERVKQLVKKGANVNHVDSVIHRGMTPLLNAAYGIEKDRGKFANAEERKQSELEAVKIVKFLVEKGAKLDVLDRKGSNALHLAAFGGRPYMIQTLVELGLDINEKNKVGATPLILAAASGSLVAVKVCLKNGSKINDMTNENATALNMALQYGSEYAQKMGMSEQTEHKEIAELLKEKGGKKGSELTE